MVGREQPGLPCDRIRDRDLRLWVLAKGGSSGFPIQCRDLTRSGFSFLAAHPNKRGKPMFLVGCRFTCPLQNPA